MGLRKRLEQSDFLAESLGALLAAYLRLCWRTGRWRGRGHDALDAARAGGGVLILFWHGHLMLAPMAIDGRGPFAVPRDPSPAGRLAAATQRRLDLEPFAIGRNDNFAALRKLIGLVRKGYGLGLTADGPKGPAGKVKRASIDWARATGSEIVLFAWSSRFRLRLGTWDRLMIPLPFAGGAFVYRRIALEIPKKPEKQDYRRLRGDLAAALNEVAAEADDLAGRKPRTSASA